MNINMLMQQAQRMQKDMEANTKRPKKSLQNRSTGRSGWWFS